MKKRGGRGKGPKTPDEYQRDQTREAAVPSTSQIQEPGRSQQEPPSSAQTEWREQSHGKGRGGRGGGRGRGTPSPFSPHHTGQWKTEETGEQAKPKEQWAEGTGWRKQSYERGRGGGRGRGRGRGTPPPSFSHETEQRTAWGRGTSKIEQTHKPGESGFSREQAVPREQLAEETGWRKQSYERGPGKERGRGRGKGTPSFPFPHETEAVKPREQLPEGNVPKLKQSLSEIKELVPYKPGILGRPITVETNHVRLNLGSVTEVFRYDVSIEPEKKPKKMLRAAMQLFLQTHFPDNYPSYDGQKLLYSAKRLPLGENDTLSDVVTISDDRGTQDFKIMIKLTGTVDLSPLHDLLQKENMEDAFHCVEVVLRQAYVSSFINIGRRFYTRPSRIEFPLGGGAQMYLGGYQAAVKGYIPFLNVDVAHKAFTIATPVVNLIMEMFSTRNRPIYMQDLGNYRLQGWQIEEMNKYLKGLKVVYKIPNFPDSKTYRMNGLARTPREEKFKQDNQNVVTVEEYFRTKYHCQLQYPNLPTIWVGSTDKKICVPMEYCTLQEGQPVDGSRMLGTQTSKMIDFSATPTTVRKQKIENVMRQANHNQNPCIREFEFSIGNQFERLDARVLDPPQLAYSNEKVRPKNGVWWAKKFKTGARIEKWTIVGFGVRRDWVNSDVNKLAIMIEKYGIDSGMVFEKPQPFDFIRNDKQSLIATLEKRKSFDLIIVVIPNKESYYLVKQIAELHIGCLTQCIKTETLNERKLNESTVRNILLKINSKMNGTNHTISDLGLISDQPCMVMGADVTHPSPQAKTIPSVVAVTASHDLTATSYNIDVYLQEPRRTMSEMIQDLENITVKKLKTFVGNVRKEPERIYFFRDGVSDGEFKRVIEVEVAAIKRACDKFRKGYSPKLTFLVVQKRHHTRFFPTDKASSGGDKCFNVPAGTCVDTVIVDTQLQSFYLVSHASIRGVSRPTKYCTLDDDNKLSNDDIQKLTFYLCHLFTRCNRAVSYPAPTYFAHLAADRAKTYIYNKEINFENLDQRLVQIDANFAKKNPMFFS